MSYPVCFLFSCSIIYSLAPAQANVSKDSGKPRTIEVDNAARVFRKDGEPFKYVAGELHYFRIPRAYWKDRLRKCRYLGLNAVSTYVEWSSHEPQSNEFDFTGENDLVSFIKLAQEENLLVLLRPGPYICAERTLGGLPAWMLAGNSDIQLRTSDPAYQSFVDRWFQILFEKIKPLLYGNGGPIFMVQVENEYGNYFQCDEGHYRWLTEKMTSYVGRNAILYTTDPGSNTYKCAPPPGVLPTIDFGAGANVDAVFDQLSYRNRGGPSVNSEFYSGWLSHWTGPLEGKEADAIVETLTDILNRNASVCLYMIHGGTNFGFTSGANAEPYKADITSYDYDAPISEAGDLTSKYFAIRSTLKKFADSYKLSFSGATHSTPMDFPKKAYGSVKLSAVVSIFNAPEIYDDEPLSEKIPQSFETLEVYSGYVLYEAYMPKKIPDFATLSILKVRDRATVYLDEEPRAIFSRSSGLNSLSLLQKDRGKKLSILVENQGYVNYDPHMQGDLKGLLSIPSMDGRPLLGWTMTKISLPNIEPLHDMMTAPISSMVKLPAFYMADFQLPQETGDTAQPADTFLDPSGWGKGVVFVNGRNMGRYWPSVGPQVTLYIPGCYLKAHPGINKLVILEEEKVPEVLEMRFRDRHKLNSTLIY
ncbi:beta-galactosidase-like [Bemisia tabaci]|uniref:beta-galactosidase-like n=1 Tax=Bemisia tabaci TaxID=7038 RepID=UPI003B2861E8